METGWRLGGDWVETGWRLGGDWMEEWDGRMGWKNGMDGMDGCIVTKVYFVPLGVVVVVVHIIFPDEPENIPDLPLAVDFSHCEGGRVCVCVCVCVFVCACVCTCV